MSLLAQPPGPGGRGGPGGQGKGGPGGRGGPGGGPLERAVADMKLSEGKRDTVLEAIRAHQDNVGRMTDVASASLLLKMKEILSSEEYKNLQVATDKVRVRPPDGRRLTVDDVVERIMLFDKNKDGKITKDELPERMQYLIEKGDTNKDGALDKEEIKALAAELAKDGSFGGAGPGGRGGPSGRGSPGSGLSLRMIERAVDDLKLSEAKKESVAAAVKAQKENAHKLTELVRAELLLQIGDVLSEQELKTFKVVLDRQPDVGERAGGPPPRGDGRPGGRPARPRQAATALKIVPLAA